MNTNIDTGKILEEMSYIFSSPEADDFHRLILNKNLAAAKKMIAKHYSKEEAKVVVDFLNAKYNQKISLVEITYKEMDLKDYEQAYVFKFGPILSKSKLINLSGDLVFYGNPDFHSIKKANQIWKVCVVN